MSSSNGRVTRQELVFVLGVTLVILVVTSIPYAYGYLSTPSDKQFMGIVLNVPDHGQYFSWMRESAKGFLIENKLTSEESVPVFFNLLFWVLGRLASGLHLDNAQVYQVFRLVAGAAFLVMAYYFCALFFERPALRKTAFLLIAIGSGFGWLLVVVKYLFGQLFFPLDIYVVEGNTFFGILASPQFVIAAFLMLAIFYLLTLGRRGGGFGYAFAAGIVGLILGLSHAYELIIIYAVLGSFSVLLTLREGISWRWIRDCLIFFFMSFPPAAYFLYITRADPVWRRVLEQYSAAGVYTPSPFHLPILLGLPFILAAMSFDGFFPLRGRTKRELFTKAWFAIGFLVIYIPTDYQIHMLNGWQVPIAILATGFLFRRLSPAISSWWEQRSVRQRSNLRLPVFRLEWLMVALVLFTAALTNIYLLGWRIGELSRHEYPFFVNQSDLQAMAWLEQYTSPSDVVLSSETMGLYVVSESGNKVFLAHGAQTLDFFKKRRLVREFFDPAISDDYRLAVIRAYGIRYVFYGQAERALGGYDPESSRYLSKAFASAKADVFRVLSEPPQIDQPERPKAKFE